MPKFEMIPQTEAAKRTATAGKKGQIMALYMFFIEQLKDGKAGKLQPSEGETVQAIRRRLGAAAKTLGKDITVKRLGQEVYFWETTEKPRKKPRRSTTGATAA